MTTKNSLSTIFLGYTEVEKLMKTIKYFIDCKLQFAPKIKETTKYEEPYVYITKKIGKHQCWDLPKR